MKLESVGILISLRPFGERDLVAHIFTRDFGIMCGMLRGAQILKKNKPIIGQYGSVSWNARLDSQLGVFHFETEKNMIASVMNDAKVLLFINSAFSLLVSLLPEREKYESLFDDTLNLLCGKQGYTEWETNLLSELGYALDLTHCSNCNCKDNLTHISQRTGRAVCKKCAEPWMDRCFELPVSLNTTKFFLEKLAINQDAKLPNARIILN